MKFYSHTPQVWRPESHTAVKGFTLPMVFPKEGAPGTSHGTQQASLPLRPQNLNNRRPHSAGVCW